MEDREAEKSRENGVGWGVNETEEKYCHLF
jgi:hypothetical protein